MNIFRKIVAADLEQLGEENPNLKKLKHFKIEILADHQINAVARFLEGQGAGDLSENDWMAKFDLFWDSNPFFLAKSDSRGWVVTDEDGNIHGFLGNIPVNYCVRGFYTKCYAATTWFVSKCARPYSLSLFREFMKQKGVLFDTTPTKDVQIIIEKRFKFKKNTSAWNHEEYIFPINKISFIYFVREKLKDIKFIAKFLPIGIIFWILNFKYNAKKFFVEKKISVIEITSLPVDVDIWWKKICNTTNFTIVRDCSSLNWLYFSPSVASKRILFEIRYRGVLLGFVGAKIHKVKSVKIIEIMDVFLLRDSSYKYFDLMVILLETLKSKNSNIAILKINPLFEELASSIKRIGFFRRRISSYYYYYDSENVMNCYNDYSGSPIDGDRALFP